MLLLRIFALRLIETDAETIQKNNWMKNLQFYKLMPEPREVGSVPLALPELPKELATNQGVMYTACRYFPDISPKSASRALRREIATYPKLKKALEETNWHPSKRSFTTLQQQIIVHFLGQPV